MYLFNNSGFLMIKCLYSIKIYIKALTPNSWQYLNIGPLEDNCCFITKS